MSFELDGDGGPHGRSLKILGLSICISSSRLTWKISTSLESYECIPSQMIIQLFPLQMLQCLLLGCLNFSLEVIQR